MSNLLERVASIATLRTMPVPQKGETKTVIVDNFSTIGDQGGGIFVWAPYSTANDDGGTIIFPTGNFNKGRWIRQFFGPVDLKWYGAKGDGVTDDATAINAWINFIKLSGHKGHAPAGVYKCDSPLVFDLAGSERKGLVIEGDGAQRTIFNLTSISNRTPFLVTDSRNGVSKDIFYPVFRDFGIHTNINGVGAMFGTENYSDAINSAIVENVLFANASGASNACAVELNYVLASNFNIVANCGGSSKGGDAIRCRQLQFSSLTGSAGNANNAIHITNGYTFGNTFLNVDMEEVNCCLAIDAAHATRNTFIGGQWSWSKIPYNCLAGSNNLIINPNPSRGKFEAANKTGLVVEFPMVTGNWTPKFLAAKNPICAYLSQHGYYMKRGSEVTVNGRIALSSYSGGNGPIEIGGLPFPTANKADNRGGASVGWANGVKINGTLALTYAPGSSSLALVQINNGVSLFLTASAITGTTDIRFTLTYETDVV